MESVQDASIFLPNSCHFLNENRSVEVSTIFQTRQIIRLWQNSVPRRILEIQKRKKKEKKKTFIEVNARYFDTCSKFSSHPERKSFGRNISDISIMFLTQFYFLKKVLEEKKRLYWCEILWYSCHFQNENRPPKLFLETSLEIQKEKKKENIYRCDQDTSIFSP